MVLLGKYHETYEKKYYILERVNAFWCTKGVSVLSLRYAFDAMNTYSMQKTYL